MLPNCAIVSRLATVEAAYPAPVRYVGKSPRMGHPYMKAERMTIMIPMPMTQRRGSNCTMRHMKMAPQTVATARTPQKGRMSRAKMASRPAIAAMTSVMFSDMRFPLNSTWKASRDSDDFSRSRDFAVSQSLASGRRRRMYSATAMGTIPVMNRALQPHPACQLSTHGTRYLSTWTARMAPIA